MAIERKNNKAANVDTNKPTHKIVVKTTYGDLQVSIFANSKNTFHKQLAEAFEHGEDITKFLGSITESAVIEEIKDVEVSKDTVSLFKSLNQAQA